MMKRILISTFATAALITSLLLAQANGSATLRLQAGDRPIVAVDRPEGVYFPLDSVVEALGGTVTRDGAGFLVTLGPASAAISPDSRYYVIGEDLVEMQNAPLTIEGRPFVSGEFLNSIISRGLGLEAKWNATSRVLEVSRAEVRPVAIQSSAVDLEDYTRVVMQLDASQRFQHEREGNVVRVRFSVPLSPAVPERRFESTYVSRVVYGRSEATVELRSPDLAVDVYTLDAPFRIVMDVRPATLAAPSGTPGDTLQPRDLPGVRTVVIDPGHGGVEVGAIGPGGLVEKNVTLEIAHRLAALLRQQGLRVILTRDSDEVVSLEQRTAIANQYKADLFLSIHLNAAPVSVARGSETYFLSLDATDDAARMAAERENSQDSAAPAPGGGDLDFILWDLAHTESVRESSRFAEIVQDEMNRINDITNRGVKQAPFKVLVGATMPAALVEVGFISNPDEEAKLASDAFQVQLTQSLADAVTRYRDDVEQRLQPQVAVAPAAATEGER